MEISLKELKPNESAIVTSIGGSAPVRRRLMDMGVTPGVKVTMRKVAPLGDPVQINLRSYELSLRKAEADQIIVTK
ncbi:FeoA family protein [Desulfosporosinus metallidurans]|uniref:Ferrous iron transport protein A n=1 Tax=Desulfosporosinus metallidurans TaxID=1888891 RepID=A0A1Q8QKZ0_9FIRM|nr:FeoA family protein [Desulfosporosinus metallidurans]OLN28007.1 Ferrous iron transport protein A [Desulfosporosinus metallidurans]